MIYQFRLDRLTVGDCALFAAYSKDPTPTQQMLMFPALLKTLDRLVVGGVSYLPQRELPEVLNQLAVALERAAEKPPDRKEQPKSDDAITLDPEEGPLARYAPKTWREYKN